MRKKSTDALKNGKTTKWPFNRGEAKLVRAFEKVTWRPLNRLRWRLIQFRFTVIKENDLRDFDISDRLLVIVRLAYRFDSITSVFPKDASNPSDEDKTDVIIQSIYKNKINYLHV